ncbi:hypothetical protein C8J56DRAFT_929158 [Mycena floridula]|nr:hypothetical protein C8J56DRAFT_929158 [Mycena floridula]
MARDLPLLISRTPSVIQPTNVHIGHVQLRDLIICPREQGIVNYAHDQSIVEHDLNKPNSTPRTLAGLSFTPNTLASLPIPGTDHTLLAAGGQEAEIHLSLHSSRRNGNPVWHYHDRLQASINNSVLLTSMSLTRSHESSIEPRLALSNNDCSVKFFTVPVRTRHCSAIQEIGSLRLNVPVNHSSISPDGRTLLSVGDSSKVFLHRLTGGSHITCSPIAILTLPPPDMSPLIYPSSSLAASFSTAFSSDGSKYAVASQEGVVAVWDVRSTKPFKIFQTDKSRAPSGNNNINGWLSDDPWEWTRGNSKAPGWSVRNVKFGSGGKNGSGREIMTFTEHTSIIHVVDARTFETEEIIHLPSPPRPTSTPAEPSDPQPDSHTSLSRFSHSTRTRAGPSYVSATSPVSRRITTIVQSPPPYIVLALEDTFRISASPQEPVWRSEQREDEESAADDLLVIPQLGDSQVDSEVHALLDRHRVRRVDYGISTNSLDDEMEVDELESDCISSHTPSRSSSPSPSVHIGTGSRSPQRIWRPWVEERPEEAKDLDIAGTCFDPTGAAIYVATTEYVAEWRVSGSEKRWWLDGDQWR